jgi:hypothetical protein
MLGKTWPYTLRVGPAAQFANAALFLVTQNGAPAWSG